MDRPGNALLGLFVLAFVAALASLHPRLSLPLLVRLSALTVGGIGFLASGVGVTVGGVRPRSLAGASLSALGVAFVSDAGLVLTTDPTPEGFVYGAVVALTGAGAVLVGVERWTGHRLTPFGRRRRASERRRKD